MASRSLPPPHALSVLRSAYRVQCTVDVLFIYLDVSEYNTHHHHHHYIIQYMSIVYVKDPLLYSKPTRMN